MVGMIALKRFLCLCLSIFSIVSLLATLSIPASADCNSEYAKVDLGYLAAHLEDFCGQKVKTVGTVSNLAHFYMYEDFWLDKMIPVVVRFAELSTPLENFSVEVCGIIEYCNLEGGFFYLNAHAWTYAEETMPEFQSISILLLFAIATSLAVIVYKKKKQS